MKSKVDMPTKELNEEVKKLIQDEWKQKRELPFECKILDEEPVEVHNHLSGRSCMLEPDAIAVYDSIKGAELLKEYEIVRQGVTWFRKHFPKEYMILLD